MESTQPVIIPVAQRILVGDDLSDHPHTTLIQMKIAWIGEVQVTNISNDIEEVACDGVIQCL